ncbi:MAG: hypothetical protein AAF442_00490 [Pseudomonadota bacterium]
MTLHYWLLTPETWLILGAILIAIEFFDGSLIFFLPFGSAALINSSILFAQNKVWIGGILSGWGHTLISLALCGCAISILLRTIIKRRPSSMKQKDINRY